MIVPDHLRKNVANEEFLIVEETFSKLSEAKVIGFASPKELA